MTLYDQVGLEGVEEEEESDEEYLVIKIPTYVNPLDRYWMIRQDFHILSFIMVTVRYCLDYFFRERKSGRGGVKYVCVRLIERENKRKKFVALLCCFRYEITTEMYCKSFIDRQKDGRSSFIMFCKIMKCSLGEH